MKITKVQRRVLQTMIDADTTVMTVRYTGGHGWGAFFRGIDKAPERDRVRIQTVWALKDKGLIKDISDPAWRWCGSNYEITDEGREAVQ